MLAAIHVYLLPYRELAGFVRVFAGARRRTEGPGLHNDVVRRAYGKRARVESVIPSFERTCGEHMTSVKWSRIVNELLVKASVYNLFAGMNP
jgi:hypothetical protein